MANDDNNILVTGFGPFSGHSINASWESVKLLPKEIDGFHIITEQIPVVYDDVDTRIPYLWKTYRPELVIHVGVSTPAKEITLETCANKHDYIKADVCGKKPTKGAECFAECHEVCLKTGLDIEKICNNLNRQNIAACVSVDAGRYLCEYIFYTSLSQDKNRSIFIHVPPLGKPYEADELATAIVEVIRSAINQLRN